MRLAYFSPVPWASFRQRPHEFVAWFRQRFGGPVLWIEPYPVRLPRASDLRRPRVSNTGATGSPEWLQRVQPRALPIEPFAAGRALHRALAWPRVMKSIATFAANEPTLIAIGKPSDLALQAMLRFPHCTTLYDAMDDFSAFHEGISRTAAARIESDIARRANVRITSSSAIARRWHAQGLDASVIPNGVASDRLPEPVSATPDAPIGYIGTVAAWFDWPWVVELAQAFPSRRIEIHGPVYRSPALDLPSNISVHPALPHEQALLRMRGFAAGLIPFLRNELTESVDPVKFYEYRALGLPVLGTPFGELRSHARDARVLLTGHPQAERPRIEALLGTRDTAESVTGFRAANDWAARFEAVAPLLP